MIYFKLQRDNGERAQYVSKQQFSSIFHICFNMPENSLMDRIFIALDKSVSPYVSLETWAQSMSLYLRGTLDEKIAYCFAVYDISGDGIIKRDHMLMLLKKSVIKHQIEDVEEAVKVCKITQYAYHISYTNYIFRTLWILLLNAWTKIMMVCFHLMIFANRLRKHQNFWNVLEIVCLSELQYIHF